MKPLLAVLVMCVSGCAASVTTDETGPASHRSEACAPKGFAEAVNALPADCEAQKANEAVAPPAAVEKVELRPASNDLGPDNVQ